MLQASFGELVVNVLVGAFVLWAASIPYWLREDGITVLVIDDK